MAIKKTVKMPRTPKEKLGGTSSANSLRRTPAQKLKMSGGFKSACK